MRALAILLILCSFILFGFTIPPAKASFGIGYKNWDANTPSKKITKELKKAQQENGPRNTFKVALIYFMQGYFSYHNEDTLYKQQFVKAIDLFRKSYSRGKKAAQKAESLQKIGISYYYLNAYFRVN